MFKLKTQLRRPRSRTIIYKFRYKFEDDEEEDSSSFDTKGDFY